PVDALGHDLRADDGDLADVGQRVRRGRHREEEDRAHRPWLVAEPAAYAHALPASPTDRLPSLTDRLPGRHARDLPSASPRIPLGRNIRITMSRTKVTTLR